MKVPFVDLTRFLDKEKMLDIIGQLIGKGSFVYGTEIREFEDALASYLRVRGAVGVSSGTQALELALKVMGISKYDKVLVPANSFIATAFAVSNTGGIPIFCDVDPFHWNMSIELVKEAYEQYGDFFAVIPVHMFGSAIPDIAEISEFCSSRGSVVIEDCAQALGAVALRKGTEAKVGSFGTLGCFSFYPTKNLGAFGNAGAIAGRIAGYYNEARRIRSYGFEESAKHLSHRIGTNANMDTIQAAVLLESIKHLDTLNDNRIQAANLYRKIIENDECLSNELSLQSFGPLPRSHVYHLFVVHISSQEVRDALMLHLKTQGIGCAIHYAVPIHQQEAYSHLPEKYQLPRVESLAKGMISLPMFAGITEEEINYVCQSIKKFYREGPGI